jgi:signal transduction histidine kinase/ActR/RegA family two-component response regulator
MTWYASGDLIEAVLARRGQLRLRLAIGAGIVLGVGALVGWAMAFTWLLCWYAIQFAEHVCAGWSARRVARGAPVLAAPALSFIFLTNLVFGFLASAAVATGERWTMMCGIWILTGGLLNAAATSRSSRAAFFASAGPSAFYCAIVPIIAWSQGADLLDLGGLVSGVALLLIAALVLRGVGLQALRQAKDASAFKSIFLANMSHEIRTPLNGVLGMAQAMAAGELPQAQRERLRVIQRSGEALLVLLNDVLDLSKIEAGKLALELGEVDFTELAVDLQESFGALSADKNIFLTVSVDEAASGLWRGDPTRVRQVLSNLISNAVKFTDQGAVKARVRRTDKGVEIEVKDTGVGIAPEHLRRLFDKFTQADATTTRKYGGTGLGLSICRDLVQLMGGDIQVASTLGEGTTFTVRLPLQPAEQRATQASDPGPMPLARSLRVLAAEDHATNQAVLRILLAQAGLEVHIVGNGQEALEAWEQEVWDVILMDVQMPIMDGPTAVRAIREREGLSGRQRVPIIALTANAMTHHVSEYLESGMDAFIAKPLDFARLVATIDQVLNGEVEAAAPVEKRSAG